jgi:AmmeMemoRadiSam system protein B
MTVTARPPAVAGQFYPGDPAALAATVDALLAAVPTAPARAAAAYVVPHAGYRYSGPTAARAYALLQAQAALVRRIVLIGPAHYVPVPGCALSGAGQWHTPLGALPLDLDGRSALLSAGLAVVDDAAHAPEHSLEVQLPFLQRVLAPMPPVLPVVIGPAAPADVAALIAAVADAGTVVLCSTDLSHYLDEENARQRDDRTVRAVLELRPEGIRAGDACGVHALRGLVTWAATAGLIPELLDQRTSASAAGDRSRVVGYAALALRAPVPPA